MKTRKSKEQLDRYLEFSLFDTHDDFYSFERIPTNTLVGIDFETEPHTKTPTIVGLCWGDSLTDGVDFDLNAMRVKGTYEKFLSEFIPWVRKVDKLVSHNIRMEADVLLDMGLTVEELYDKMYDSMVLPYVLNSNDLVGLKACVGRYFGESRIKWKEAINLSRKEYRMYCRTDAYDTRRLWNFLYQQVVEKGCIPTVELEHMLAWDLLDKARKGINMDIPLMKSLTAKAEKEMISTNHRILKLLQRPIKFTSPKKLKSLLFDHWKLDKSNYRKQRLVPVTSPGFVKIAPMNDGYELLDKYKMPIIGTANRLGNGYTVPIATKYLRVYSTTVEENTLRDIAGDLNAPKIARRFTALLIKYTNARKFVTTYLKGKLQEFIGPDAMLRVQFVSCGGGADGDSTDDASAGPVTSRLSSKPNVQNISARNPKRKILRKAFKARKGFKLIVLDFKAAEVRVLTEFSQDPNFVEVLRKGEDPHNMTVEKLKALGVSISRAIAKVVNFGIAYNMQAKALALKLKIELGMAREIVSGWSKANPTTVKYLRRMKEFVRQNKYLRLISGQYVYFDDTQDWTDNMACNFPIQGFVGCYTKLLMAFFYKYYYGTQVSMLMQVHDEFIFEVPETDVDSEIQIISYVMENMYKMSIPFPVDAGIGDNWYVAKH